MIEQPTRKLILIKHAVPVIDRAVPGKHWRLGDRGREQARRLADRLAAHDLVAVVGSTEPKASATGAIVAAALRLPFHTAPDLHENDRTDLPFLSTADLHATIARFFAAPDQIIMGHETAQHAADRFERAVRAALAQQPHGNLGIAAHGTVITLFVARYNLIEPCAFWGRLGLPSFVVLDVPSFTLQNVVESI